MSRRVVVVVVGALLGLVHAGPARASGEVLVSNTDGDFAETLAQPLFDPALRWVPGDVRSATFYVWNTTSGPAGLSLSVIDDDAGALLDSGALEVRVSSDGTPWSPDPRGPARTMRSEVPLAAGCRRPRSGSGSRSTRPPPTGRSCSPVSCGSGCVSPRAATSTSSPAPPPVTTRRARTPHPGRTADRCRAPASQPAWPGCSFSDRSFSAPGSPW